MNQLEQLLNDLRDLGFAPLLTEDSQKAWLLMLHVPGEEVWFNSFVLNDIIKETTEWLKERPQPSS